MFATAIANAVASAPQTLADKIDRLLVDADGLCYFCAGSATTTPGQSLMNVQEKLKAVEAVAGIRATLVCTADGSPKGNRYTIATVKPYQGNRGKSPKPKNWAFLRQRMLGGEFGRQLLVEEYAEADDLCRSMAGPRTALHYQDKDFQMMPGWHLTWKNYDAVFVPEGAWEIVAGTGQRYNGSDKFIGKVYGEKWFWLQMLMGDPADNIPGIPKLYGKQCGPAGAEKLLAGLSRDDARKAVRDAYMDHYSGDWSSQFLEQAQLLYMRANPGNDLDVIQHGFLKGMDS